MTRRQALSRIIVTYLIVLLPLMVVSIFVTQNLLRNVKQEEVTKISMQLDRISSAVDEDFISYTNKGSGLMQMKPFSHGQIMGKPIVQLEAIELLQKLRLFDNCVNEILVYYGEEYLCGNNGITSPQVYFNTTINCNAVSTQRAIELLQSESAGAIILESKAGSPHLMYHIPVGHDQMGRLRSVQYIFTISNMESILDSYTESNGVLIQLTYGDVVTFFYNEESGCNYLNKEKAEALLSNMEGDVIETTSEGGYANVRIWYDYTQQMKGYWQIRNFSLLILILGVFLSTAFSVGLGFRRMSSIRSLANNIIGRRVSKPKPESWRSNEFDYIQALVDQSTKDNDLVKRKANNYRFVVLQNVANMIFHGILRDRDEIQTLLSACGTGLVEEYYYICGIWLETADDAERLEPYIHEDLYYTDGEHLVVMLCQIPSADYEMTQRKDIAQRFLSTLSSINIRCRQIVMSQVYNQISMANYAYLEISSILEHSDGSDEAILCWEDLVTSQERNNFRFKNEDLQTFYGAMEQKNYRTAEKMLDRIFLQNRQRENEEYVRYMRYMVTQAMRLASRTAFDKEDLSLQQQLDSIEEQDISAFLFQAKSIIRGYCQDNGAYDKIVAYVNENYARYDLSLEQLAEEANISKAQMSKIFRSKTGTCYIDYVTNLRMEKARELLAESNLGVKEIFSQVGYIDSTNASKKFKTIYGVTPSAYRTQMQKRSQEDGGNG